MTVSEMHRVEHESKHQHHVDEINHIDKSIVKLGVFKIPIICLTEEIIESPISKCKHRNMDSKQEQSRRNEGKHIHEI